MGREKSLCRFISVPAQSKCKWLRAAMETAASAPAGCAAISREQRIWGKSLDLGKITPKHPRGAGGAGGHAQTGQDLETREQHTQNWGILSWLRLKSQCEPKGCDASGEGTARGSLQGLTQQQTSHSGQQRGEKLLGFNLLCLQKYSIKEGEINSGEEGFVGILRAEKEVKLILSIIHDE